MTPNEALQHLKDAHADDAESLAIDVIEAEINRLREIVGKLAEFEIDGSDYHDHPTKPASGSEPNGNPEVTNEYTIRKASPEPHQETRGMERSTPHIIRS